jgi:hypothetical protein
VGLRDDEIQRVLDYQHIFLSEPGRRVLEDMRRAFYFYRSTHVPGDPHGSAYREGMREVVLKIEHMLTVDADRVVSTRGVGEFNLEDDNG